MRIICLLASGGQRLWSYTLCVEGDSVFVHGRRGVLGGGKIDVFLLLILVLSGLVTDGESCPGSL